MNRLGTIFAYIAGLIYRPAAPVRRVYEIEFCDRSAAKITLSTHYPKFHALFSECPSRDTYESYLAQRAEILFAFEKLTGTRIGSGELENETYRPYPAPRVRDEERHRANEFPPYNIRSR